MQALLFTQSEPFRNNPIVNDELDALEQIGIEILILSWGHEGKYFLGNNPKFAAIKFVIFGVEQIQPMVTSFNRTNEIRGVTYPTIRNIPVVLWDLVSCRKPTNLPRITSYASIRSSDSFNLSLTKALTDFSLISKSNVSQQASDVQA